MRGADALIHVAGDVPHRHPALASGRRCGTRTSARPSGSSTPRSRRASRGSCTSRPSTCSATPTAASSTRPTAATSPTGFLSLYDETKYRAHEAAEERVAAGAPIVIVMPSQVYGPHDHTLASDQLGSALRGHAAIRGARQRRHRAGCTSTTSPTASSPRWTGARLGEALRLLAGEHRARRGASRSRRALGGQRPPRMRRARRRSSALIAPLNDAVGGLPGMPANMRETIASGDGVTYWAPRREGRGRARLRAATLEPGYRRHVGRRRRVTPRPAVHSTTMARELPIFDPTPRPRPRAGARAISIAIGGGPRSSPAPDGSHAAPPPPRLDQGAACRRARTTTSSRGCSAA